MLPLVVHQNYDRDLRSPDTAPAAHTKVHCELAEWRGAHDIVGTGSGERGRHKYLAYRIFSLPGPSELSVCLSVLYVCDRRKVRFNQHGNQL